MQFLLKESEGVSVTVMKRAMDPKPKSNHEVKSGDGERFFDKIVKG